MTLMRNYSKSKFNNTIGVLGGLGPLASAEFLKTLYKHNITHIEQESIKIILMSDPTFPDRTESISSKKDKHLLKMLTDSLQKLRELNVSPIIICCMTMHVLLPKLPKKLKGHVVSLIDIIYEQVLKEKKTQLVLCTKGVRESKLFEKHSKFRLAKKYLIFPDNDDQETIHKLVYKIKSNSGFKEIIDTFYSLLNKYSAESLIMGCTEFHLITNHEMKVTANNPKINYIDPLEVFSKNIQSYLFHTK